MSNLLKHLCYHQLTCNHQVCKIQNSTIKKRLRLRPRDWDKFIQHNMTLYRCMISDIHDSSYVLYSTNLISNTSLHVGRPLLRPFLVAYAEATLARQKQIAQQTKSDDIISEYLLRTNGQLFDMNVKIMSSYWQAGKAFDPMQHD